MDHMRYDGTWFYLNGHVIYFRILVDGGEQSNITADIAFSTEVGGVQFHLAV
ncbi:hypothetical protein JXB22_03205 [candidate division WOR-3 bacterium]|nr:hypothetical protein [candidate division WOR-3 bacterium]